MRRSDSPVKKPGRHLDTQYNAGQVLRCTHVHPNRPLHRCYKSAQLSVLFCHAIETKSSSMLPRSPIPPFRYACSLASARPSTLPYSLTKVSIIQTLSKLTGGQGHVWQAHGPHGEYKHESCSADVILLPYRSVTLYQRIHYQ